MPIDTTVLIPGHIYWVAYQVTNDGTDIECAPFAYDGLVDSWGKHQFTPDDGPKVYLFPNEITSVADSDGVTDNDDMTFTAADVAQTLNDAGFTMSRLWPGYERSEGVYTADLPTNRGRVGVYTYPAGDKPQLDVAAATLSVIGLEVTRSVHIDAGEYLITWFGE